MKAMMRRSFRSAALVAVALLVGLAAVPLFAGADALETAKTSLLGESNSCSLQSAKARAESEGGNCVLSLMKDPGCGGEAYGEARRRSEEFL